MAACSASPLRTAEASFAPPQVIAPGQGGVAVRTSSKNIVHPRFKCLFTCKCAFKAKNARKAPNLLPQLFNSFAALNQFHISFKNTSSATGTPHKAARELACALKHMLKGGEPWLIIGSSASCCCSHSWSGQRCGEWAESQAAPGQVPLSSSPGRDARRPGRRC